MFFNQDFTTKCSYQTPTHDETSLSLKRTSELKVSKMISSLSNSRAKDIHGIDTVCLKKLHQ